MIRIAFRGLLARKLRALLTALAIVLGVAMVCGTYVLTDSIHNAFNSIFTDVYRGTDATITGRSAFGSQQNAPSFDESLLARVRALPDVREAVGGVGGDAHLIGRNGKAIGFGGAPNLGFSVDPNYPEMESLILVDGSAQMQPGDIERAHHFGPRRVASAWTAARSGVRRSARVVLQRSRRQHQCRRGSQRGRRCESCVASAHLGHRPRVVRMSVELGSS